MEKDIVPGLLELIEKEFDEKTFNSDVLKKAILALRDKKATYKDANEFAIEIGEILSKVLNTHITLETLPDGKMYFNIADRIMNSTMRKNYDLITGYAIDVQTELNHSAGLKLKGQKPKLNQSRIDGIVERLSTAEEFEEIKWILDEPIKNFNQSIVDDTVKANMDFHARTGLKPKIARIVVSDCCDWCREIAGTYDYGDEPRDIYKRHRFCRCRVEYNPKDGRGIQDSHTKEWKDPERESKIEARKKIGIENKIKNADLIKFYEAMDVTDYAEFKELLNNSSDEVKELYTKYTKELNIIKHNKGGGSYQPSSKTLEYNFDRNIKHPEINKYSTLAHEFGHHVDSTAILKGTTFKEIEFLNERVRIGDSVGTFFKRQNSTSDNFLSAIRADRDSLSKITKNSLDHIRLSDASHGVQDALDGMFGLKEAYGDKKVNWGHGSKYYNRTYSSINNKMFKNEKLPQKLKDAYNELGFNANSQGVVKKITRDYETASEVWANIMAADTVGGAELEYVKQYLPNSYDAYKMLIKGVD